MTTLFYSSTLVQVFTEWLFFFNLWSWRHFKTKDCSIASLFMGTCAYLLKLPGAWKYSQKHFPASWRVRRYTSPLLPRQASEPQRPHNRCPCSHHSSLSGCIGRRLSAQNNSDNRSNNTKWLSTEFGSLQSRCLQNWLFLRPHMQDLSLASP